MPMRSALATMLLLVSATAGADDPGRWWLGFIDQSGRAFLEIPAEARTCGERDRLVARSMPAPGEVLVSPRPAASQVQERARLTFGVADMRGEYEEKVFTRIVAIGRDDERARPSLQPACLYLAEAGAYRAGALVQEDRIAVGVHPPRRIRVHRHEDSWRNFGGSARMVGADSRFVAESDAPAWVPELVRAHLPGAGQFHAQPFDATLAAGSAPERLWLVGGVRDGETDPGQPGTYNTVNLIVRESSPESGVLYRNGPSGGIGRDRGASFVAQVAATMDLDGDGSDEVLLRARHYAGGNLMVLRWQRGGFVVVRHGGYEGE